MVDMMAIQGLISGLQTATDITKALYQLKASADVQAKVVELQSAILSAQASALTANAEQFAMIQRVRDLEEEVRRVKAWEEQKQRYKLVYPWEDSMTTVYALKESCKGAEAPHWICAKCYDDGRRTVLQPKESARRGFLLLVCATCKAESHTGYTGLCQPVYAPN